MKRTLTQAVMTAAVLGTALVGGKVFGQQTSSCLHGTGETEAQRTRRVQALTLTRQINTLEAVESQRLKSFVPVEQLALTAAIPQGFDTALLTDGKGYAFSVKDTTDPCGFLYFSDQEGRIYSGEGIR
jgi:hypothetical protein